MPTFRLQAYKTRAEFEEVVHTALVEHNIELICLAGFMRVLTASFVDKWKGRLLNVHPSLLPSFKGTPASTITLDRCFALVATHTCTRAPMHPRTCGRLVPDVTWMLILLHSAMTCPCWIPSVGMDAQKQALDSGCTITGCTVHFVDSGVDTGPIIVQEPVPIVSISQPCDP